MPKAINSVVFRIAVFYVGSLILLALLLPYTGYKQGTSPFVTFFASIGVPAAGDIMNFVVLTAALSSLNARLYSTGRILRLVSLTGSAPQFTARMTKRGVPFAGIALTACFPGTTRFRKPTDRYCRRSASSRRGPPSRSVRSSCTAGLA
jgi:L-asparagine permease